MSRAPPMALETSADVTFPGPPAALHAVHDPGAPPMTATTPSPAAPYAAEQHPAGPSGTATVPVDPPDPRTLASMVVARMRRHPDRLAVLDDERSLTYAELDR